MDKSSPKNTLTSSELHQLSEIYETLKDMDVSGLSAEEQGVVNGIRSAVMSCMAAEDERRNPRRLTNKSIWDGGWRGIAAWGRAPSTPSESSLLTIKSFVESYRDSEPSTPLQATLRDVSQSQALAKLISFLDSPDLIGRGR